MEFAERNAWDLQKSQHPQAVKLMSSKITLLRQLLLKGYEKLSANIVEELTLLQNADLKTPNAVCARKRELSMSMLL